MIRHVGNGDVVVHVAGGEAVPSCTGAAAAPLYVPLTSSAAAMSQIPFAAPQTDGRNRAQRRAAQRGYRR